MRGGATKARGGWVGKVRRGEGRCGRGKGRSGGEVRGGVAKAREGVVEARGCWANEVRQGEGRSGWRGEVRSSWGR